MNASHAQKIKNHRITRCAQQFDEACKALRAYYDKHGKPNADAESTRLRKIRNEIGSRLVTLCGNYDLYDTIMTNALS
jgi:hypothetical protein